MICYHIRDNASHNETDLTWSVFENAAEHLVKNLQMRTPSRGESTEEHGKQKWNVTCEGHMQIQDGVAIIE